VFLWIALTASPARAADVPIDADLTAVGPWTTDDFSRIARSLQTQAYQGIAYAQAELALLYLQGKGVSQNPAEAAKWMRKAAEQGWPIADYDLGVMSLNGLGVPQDGKGAAAWFRKAAHREFFSAQYALAQMYQRGVGVERDPALALAWIDALIGHLSPSARPDIRSKYEALRASIASELTADQLANAKRFTSQEGPTPRAVIRNRIELEKSIVYPIGLRHLDRQGSVTVLVLVGVDGRAKNQAVEMSSGFPKLDDVVLQSLGRAEFEPRMIDGQPIESWQIAKWTFSLH